MCVALIGLALSTPSVTQIPQIAQIIARLRRAALKGRKEKGGPVA